MLRLLFFPIYFVLFSVFGQDSIAIRYSSVINAQDMKIILYKLASDEFEGRETATKGQKLAANYIAEQFSASGMIPQGDSAYFQKYYIEKNIPAEFTVSYKGKKIKSNEQCFVFSTPKSTKVLATEFVLIDSGKEEISKMDFSKNNLFPVLFSVINSKGEEKVPFNIIRELRNAKPSAVMVIVRDESLIKYNADGSSQSPFLNLAGTDREKKSVPVILITEKAFEKILKADKEKKSIEQFKSELAEKNTINIPLKNKFEAIIENQNELVTDGNVIGLIEGTDKKEEYIVISAHYDHLGKRGDKIYYGADDDGSGTTAIMEIGKAFAKAKKEGNGPRRSIVCIAFSGEEKGLLGSEYYTKNPTIALEKIIANLNIDMIGRIDEKHLKDTSYIYLIGSDKLSTQLHQVSEKANKEYVNLILDYTYNEPNDPNRFYYRSDHYNFAKNKIPVIFYFNGVHADYHKPTDTPDKINYKLMENRARLVFFTAWELANRNEKITVDVPDDSKKP